MINYGKQSIDKNDINAIVDTLGSDWLTQGPKVVEFEQSLSNYFGAKYCSAVSNGTAALHLTGLALGWEPEDIIITTPITFLATANCILYSGATPDFVDIDPTTYTLDPNQLEKKIRFYRSRGKKVKAIIGVDYAGHPCDWKALREIADKYELQLINDNCHALGASYFEDKQYALKYADIVTQSYHPVKHITTGEGGSILTNNSDIDEKVKLLRSHGMIKKEDKLNSNEGPWYYEMHEIGFNYRITDFQCALGINQLKKLNHFIKQRNELALSYNNSFKNIKFLSTPKIADSIDHAYHLYPIQIDFGKTKFDKKHFFKLMGKKGISLQVHYIPIHLQPFYQNNFKFKKGDFPIAENFYLKEVSLPIYPDLLPSEQNLVIRSLKNIIMNGK